MIKDDLMDILTTARLNNALLGVTGMLLYTGKNFIQVLEGDEKVIEALTADIRKDSRHKDIHIVEKKHC
jgi:hypothetical protein